MRRRFIGRRWFLRWTSRCCTSCSSKAPCNMIVAVRNYDSICRRRPRRRTRRNKSLSTSWSPRRRTRRRSWNKFLSTSSSPRRRARRRSWNKFFFTSSSPRTTTRRLRIQ